MAEYKFQLVIVPEDYDYGEEEIAYRIYFKDQLISERSLPILKPNQAMVDTFYIEIKNYTNANLLFQNLKCKKAMYKKIIVNDLILHKNTKGIKLNGLNLKIIEYINNTEEISNGI